MKQTVKDEQKVKVNVPNLKSESPRVSKIITTAVKTEQDQPMKEEAVVPEQQEEEEDFGASSMF